MSIVVDSSVVFAALLDSGPDGQWAERVLAEPLTAPHLMPFEVSNIIRRTVASGHVSREMGQAAAADLECLPVSLFGFNVVAERCWELGDNLTSYDASYVGLAELLGIRLATLDLRLTRSSGPRCEFITPDP